MSHLKSAVKFTTHLHIKVVFVSLNHQSSPLPPSSSTDRFVPVSCNQLIHVWHCWMISMLLYSLPLCYIMYDCLPVFSNPSDFISVHVNLFFLSFLTDPPIFLFSADIPMSFGKRSFLPNVSPVPFQFLCLIVY